MWEFQRWRRNFHGSPGRILRIVWSICPTVTTANNIWTETSSNDILERTCEGIALYEIQKKYSISVSILLLDNVWIGGLAILD
jgi:hypothetical protein